VATSLKRAARSARTTRAAVVPVDGPTAGSTSPRRGPPVTTRRPAGTSKPPTGCWPSSRRRRRSNVLAAGARACPSCSQCTAVRGNALKGRHSQTSFCVFFSSPSIVPTQTQM
jgi:hypothetical protein